MANPFQLTRPMRPRFELEFAFNREDSTKTNFRRLRAHTAAE